MQVQVDQTPIILLVHALTQAGEPNTAIVSGSVRVFSIDTGVLVNILTPQEMVNIEEAFWIYEWTPVDLTPGQYWVEYTLTDSDAFVTYGSEELNVTDYLESDGGSSTTGVVTVDDVRAKLPAFSELTDDEIEPSLEEATLLTEEDNWGDLYTLGVIYLTGHLLSLEGFGADSGAGVGPVTSRTVGRVSVSYASPVMGSESEHGSTWYGRRYDQLAERVGRHILVV